MTLTISSLLMLTLTACAYAGDVYKILVVSPMPGKSHVILGDGVVKLLAAAGHQITYITAIPSKTPQPNVRQIDASTNFDKMNTDMINIKHQLDKESEMDVLAAMEMMLLIHNATYQTPGVQALLANTAEQFDLVIAEWMFNELYSGFAAIFDAPYVWLSTLEPHWMVLRLVDQALSPAYSAHFMSSSLPPFSFYERVGQLMYQLKISALRYFYVYKYETPVYESLGKYIRMRGREPPAYEELQYNASLILGNSHVSMGQATTLPLSYKSIGGYHIDPKPTPLPTDLQKILDNARHGLIYFSMGSNLKSKDLPDELKRAIPKMFGTLKQTVLWKFEEVLPDLPSNVHILSWAPQQSILAHPNCVLFITHGGLLSTTETIHYAKPIIGIPVFADQFVNVDRAVSKGFAKRVDLSYTIVEDLKAAIDELLHNPSYTNKVRELSFVYHHRPAPPGAELLHWVEHVIKTRGAPHLRSPAISVPFYQKMYLDLLALIVAVCLLIRYGFRRMFKKSAKKVKKN